MPADKAEHQLVLSFNQTTPFTDLLSSFQAAKGRALIRVRLAKMKLYEAKVGIVEAQKRWDQCGLGESLLMSLKIHQPTK